MRGIIPHSGETIPVMEASPHKEGTVGAKSLMRSTTLSRYSKMGGVVVVKWFRCEAGRVAR